MDDEGGIAFVRARHIVNALGDGPEAFCLRVHDEGKYCCYGVDLGCVLARGRMQTDERELLYRAKQWNSPIKAQFRSVPLTQTEVVMPPDMTAGKWSWKSTKGARKAPRPMRHSS